MRALVMDQRLPEKLAHAPVDFSRSEIIVIQKNLELCAGLLVVIRQRDRNRSRRRCLWFWRRFRAGRLGLFRHRLGREGNESENENQNSEMHRRSNRLESKGKQTRVIDSRRRET